MRKVYSFLAISLCLSSLLAISGCTQPPREIPQLSRAARENYLNHMRQWELTARLGIRNKDQGQNLSVDWQQDNDHFKLYLYSPLAIDNATIKGKPGSVSLTMSDGNHYTAENPEKLVLDHLGWNLPFTGLEYWIKGMPAPHSTPTNVKYDSYNQLRSLQQDGWCIEFEEYSVHQNITLPEKITLINNNVKLKVIINRWKK